MSRNDFDHLVSTIITLSPAQMRRLARAIESRLAATAGRRTGLAERAGQEAEETAYDLAKRAGLIGCIKGAPRSATDLSTNPNHMEGFARD
jgi:hypothetical protein